ncbi:MAG: fumarylacetoacetate hydrolase family protein [Chloroflexota bacterium]|nr:fumarylacetoacetate hydrolase family protein [Chloroflexota bacterium]
MKWCRFQVGNKVAFGMVGGDEVIEVSGSPFETYQATKTRHPLSRVKLLIPCVPPTFYAAGVNYRAHVQWAATVGLAGSPNPPTKADIGYRANNALIAHEENIVVPKDSSGVVEYEGELVAVIGKKAKHLSREEALGCVLGYTIGNDLSERSWQKQDRTLWRAKNTDTFKPMGPWIVTGLDPNNIDMTIKLNGKVVSQFNTGKMVFDVAHYISTMSRYLTLYPGDVIWTGTDNATGPMRPGDVVEVEASHIGVLRNRVVAEQ